MTIVIPDFEWYSKISDEFGGPPRCPFATASHCPRYYQSLSLLKETGATSIDAKVDDSLLQKWKNSPLWPLVAEQETAVMGTDEERAKIISNFCPEVSYDRWGIFATFLARYADGIDIDLAHKSLSERDASREDWRWEWASIRPQHYKECPFYSILQRPDEVKTALENFNELLEIKPGMFGITVNVKNLVTKFCLWWLNKQRKNTESGSRGF